MPSNLWVSLESPYQRCPSRYNAISRSVTISQNMQLIFLTYMDSFYPFLVRLFCSREPVFLPFLPRVGPLSASPPRSSCPAAAAPTAPRSRRPAPRGRRPAADAPRIRRPKGSAAQRSRRRQDLPPQGAAAPTAPPSAKRVLPSSARPIQR